MVSKFCSRSHGHPPGARSRAMISTARSKRSPVLDIPPTVNGHSEHQQIDRSNREGSATVRLWTFLALGDDQSNVIVLFVRTKALNLVDDCREVVSRRQFTMPTKALDQTEFAEFFARGVEGFGDAVCVKRERVSREQPTLAD